ncbi:sensor histidine kinase [Stenotrophomonas maltophilia]|uniref:sensor histidine kinase n=1 Tax=Stenotrophomonas maltophilia TaxID=40324 RepID=UPI003D7DE99E
MFRIFRSPRLCQHATPDVIDDCDLAALRKYQRGVLLGGGCLLSTVIVAGLIALAQFHSDGFAARRSEALQRSRAIVEAHFAASDAAHVRLLSMAEYAWRHRPDSDVRTLESDRASYLRAGQRAVMTAGAESVPQTVLGVGTDTWPVDRLDRYLMLAHSLSIIRQLGGSGGQSSESESSFFLDPRGQLLVLGEGMTEQRLLSATGGKDRAQLIERLAALSKTGDHGPDAYGTHPTRMELVRHPVSHAPAIASALVARDGATLIGTFVTLESTAPLSRALRIGDGGASFVLTGDGRVVAGTSSPKELDLGAVTQHLRQAERKGRTLNTFRQGLRFYQVVRVKEADWVLISTYCVADVIADGQRLYIAAASLAFGLLLGLWTLLAWLHWRAFGPALARAARVYQGEQLSRALIQLSPVGLCLLERHTGDPVVQNDMMLQLAATADRRGVMLYARMVEQASAILSLPNITVAEFEITVPDPQGLAPVVLLVGATSANYQGRMVLLCAVRDLSARIELEQHQKRAREAAEAASRAKSRFLAAMSHEIRTPLHGILGHLELLGRAALDENQQARIRRITQAADSLLQIINDVLDFSRAESGRLDLVPETFEPVALLERVALLFSPLAEAKGLVLDVIVDDAVPVRLIGPQARMEQVLRNLVSNAVKFTPSGRVELRADWLPDADPSQLQLQVIDSGIGMTKTQIARLFQPYVQADASIITRFGGSGLGLSLCRELSSCMGGAIQASSTPGVGSVFTFCVPVQVAPATGARPLADRSVLLSSSASGWRDELRRRLEHWGAAVIIVNEADTLPAGKWGAHVPLVTFERCSAGSDLASMTETRRVILVTADGPLKPQVRGNAWRVSCYSNDGLLQALLVSSQRGGVTLAAEGCMH